MSEWLSSAEALARLGVRPQTLYAYVSRGRVRAEADPVEPRRSRYRASDIAALSARRARGRRAADVAAHALAARAAADPAAHGRAAADLATEAAMLLDLMAAAVAGEAAHVAGEEEAEGPIHERLGRAWRVRREDWDLIRRALVLLADHELN